MAFAAGNLKRAAMEQSSLRPIFQTIYQKQLWGHGSGPGSSPTNTVEYRAFVERFIEANSIRSVTDLGCGDWQFSQLIDWSQIDYLGLDVVPEIVAQNRSRFAPPNLRFQELTSIDDLPGGDLLLSKEVLQHLPNQTIVEYLLIIQQKYRFALLTNSIGLVAKDNIDVAAGGYRPVRLQDAPFNAPGAVVFTYFPHTANAFYKNAVFLMLGALRSK
jgi:SAM-dependent methyltransferase